MKTSRSAACLIACLSVLGVEATAHAADAVSNEPASAPGKQAPTSSLEGFALVGPSLVQGDPANAAATTSFRRVGIYGEFGAAYRSHYFLDPFISVGYASLASADTKLADGDYGTGGTLHQHLGFWLISPGITTEIWRIRLRLGIGLGIVKQSDTFQSQKNTGTQTPIAGQVGLGFNCYATDRFRLDVDARYVKAQGADVSFGLLGITARGDLITFGGGG
jgi:hypothetical protein